jgi:hypothetical protein
MTNPEAPEQRDEQEHQRHRSGPEEEKAKLSDPNPPKVLLFAVGIALFGLVAGLVLDWYIDPQTSTQKKDLIQALALIIAGVGGAIGIIFTWRGQQITQKSLADTRESAEENLRLTREGQITERFTRAIDQLGKTDDKRKPLLEIRLGGIYALERIVKDSPKDNQAVMEVLTAYIRANAPASPEEAQGNEQDVLYSRQKEPPADIRAIVHVVRRRDEDRIPEKYRLHLDLSRTNLRGADLSEAYLGGAYLRYADLRGAYLPEVDFSGADLRYANLRGAYLGGDNFKGAYLRRAKLRSADLSGAELGGAYLGGAELTYAILRGADLSAAKELKQQQLAQTLGDDTTKLPEGCQPPPVWRKSFEEQMKLLRGDL